MQIVSSTEKWDNLPTKKGECSGYDAKLLLMVRLQSMDEKICLKMVQFSIGLCKKKTFRNSYIKDMNVIL